MKYPFDPCHINDVVAILTSWCRQINAIRDSHEGLVGEEWLGGKIDSQGSPHQSLQVTGFYCIVTGVKDRKKFLTQQDIPLSEN